MKLESTWKFFGGLASLALLAGLGLSTAVAQKPDSEELSNLLSEAKSHAALVEEDASSLEDFTRTKLAWRTHATKLNQIKEHVNDLGKLNKQLSDLRGQGSPWQQKAIDQIDPLLREMAAQLTTTINHLNDNNANIHMRQYREYAEANHLLANRMAELVRDFVEYDKATFKAESLESKLDLPAEDTHN